MMTRNMFWFWTRLALILMGLGWFAFENMPNAAHPWGMFLNGLCTQYQHDGQSIPAIDILCAH